MQTASPSVDLLYIMQISCQAPPFCPFPEGTAPFIFSVPIRRRIFAADGSGGRLKRCVRQVVAFMQSFFALRRRKKIPHLTNAPFLCRII